MRLLEHSYDAPAENLALDEVLLDEAEAGRSDEVLRFWTSPVHFVVLGLSQALEEHAFREACERDRVPILRRCSAGGCVLQGPGCLNYSLVLHTDRPGCETIHSSYRTILGMMVQALEMVGVHAAPAGTSDLAIGQKKISGSAQRRRKHFFLHHGTLLSDFDFTLCTRYLREPADQPSYRENRPHKSFLTNIPSDMPSLVRSVSEVFHAHNPDTVSLEIQDAMLKLVGTKYSLDRWTFRK